MHEVREPRGRPRPSLSDADVDCTAHRVVTGGEGGCSNYAVLFLDFKSKVLWEGRISREYGDLIPDISFNIFVC